MDGASEFYDELETRSADAREADLMAKLPDQVANAKSNAPYFAECLAEIDPAAVTTRAALAALPSGNSETSRPCSRIRAASRRFCFG